jgi:hypothetical protein
MLVVRPVAALAVVALAVASALAVVMALVVAVSLALAVARIAVPVPLVLVAAPVLMTWWRRGVAVASIVLGAAVRVTVPVAVCRRRGRRGRRRRGGLGSDRHRLGRRRRDRLGNPRACGVAHGEPGRSMRDRASRDPRGGRDRRPEGGRLSGRKRRGPARRRRRERHRVHHRRRRVAPVRATRERRRGHRLVVVDNERWQVHGCQNGSGEGQPDHDDCENSAQFLPRLCRFTLALYRQNGRNP